jgi:hypothetical protein
MEFSNNKGAAVTQNRCNAKESRSSGLNDAWKPAGHTRPERWRESGTQPSERKNVTSPLTTVVKDAAAPLGSLMTHTAMRAKTTSATAFLRPPPGRTRRSLGTEVLVLPIGTLQRFEPGAPSSGRDSFNVYEASYTHKSYVYEAGRVGVAAGGRAAPTRRDQAR